MTHSDSPTDAFQPRSAITRTLVERGYVNQVTDLAGVDSAFAAGIVPVYAGWRPRITADLVIGGAA